MDSAFFPPKEDLALPQLKGRLAFSGENVTSHDCPDISVCMLRGHQDQWKHGRDQGIRGARNKGGQKHRMPPEWRSSWPRGTWPPTQPPAPEPGLTLHLSL